jgi:hypothetical protein
MEATKRFNAAADDKAQFQDSGRTIPYRRGSTLTAKAR